MRTADSTSHELMNEALRYTPGGVNSPLRAYRAMGGQGGLPVMVAAGMATLRGLTDDVYWRLESLSARLEEDICDH